MNDLLEHLYDSHGCIHLTPSDALLLTSTISPGTPLKIKRYDVQVNTDVKSLPELASLVMGENDIEKLRFLFSPRQTKLVAYPFSKTMIVYVGGTPYARVSALPGPGFTFRMPLEVNKDGPIVWDPWPVTPTDPGNFSVLGTTDHYISPTYRDTTLLPFGAWIMKRNGSWYYQYDDLWKALPDYIVRDITAPEDERKYEYFDVNRNGCGSIEAARWGSHDFGRNVLQWTRDGRNHRPEMAYSCGSIMLDQVSLVKSLAYLLTADGPDDFEKLVSGSKRLSFYRDMHKFIKTGIVPELNGGNPRAYAYFRLYNKWPMSESDRAMMDDRLVNALKAYRERKLPLRRRDREETIGLYYYLKLNSKVIMNYANWYSKLKEDWPLWAVLRSAIRSDLDSMGVPRDERGRLAEKWLTDRLEFRRIVI